MILKIGIGELVKIFGGSEKSTINALKKIFKIGVFYLILMVATAIFTFIIPLLPHLLFALECTILYYALTIPIFLITVYYAAYFAKKGWNSV